MSSSPYLRHPKIAIRLRCCGSLSVHDLSRLLCGFRQQKITIQRLVYGPQQLDVRNRPSQTNGLAVDPSWCEIDFVMNQPESGDESPLEKIWVEKRSLHDWVDTVAPAETDWTLNVVDKA